VTAATLPAVEPILSGVELYKHFGGLVAVDHVSLDVDAGEVLGYWATTAPASPR